jgi:hypothetical protein
MGVIQLSFDLDMTQILQYAYNIFGSLQGMLYMFLGAALAIFILAKILKTIREQ